MKPTSTRSEHRRTFGVIATSALLTICFSQTANAIFPEPREGTCDPAVYPPFPDNNIGPGTLKGTPVLEDPKLFDYIKNRTRRVEPRNTPTMINAALNNKNFWDGRANTIFNGVNESGAGDENSRVLRAVGKDRLEPYKVRLDFSSLASQAVGPIVSREEMAFFDRPLRDVGKRLVSARPPAKQRFHPEDSVLAKWISQQHVRIARTGFENTDVSPSFQPPEQVERMYNGNCEVQVYEQGFYNIGVRPTEEDIGAGALDPFGNPLNAADILAADPASLPSQELLEYVYPNIANPPVQVGERTGMQGAFKIPGLRNVELTAPYFHNGGKRTLREVVEFYNRGGDFHDHNDFFMDFEVGKLGLTEDEINAIVAFLLTLTDERVRNQEAPFDHPELLVANGHPGDDNQVVSKQDAHGEAEDVFVNIPAVGKNGGPLPDAFLEGVFAP